jgi:hypothetical protein
VNLLVDGLACARLTRLLRQDTITAPLRSRLVERAVASGRFGVVELLSCPWCTAVWVAGGVVAARALAPRAWPWAARLLAVAQLAGLASYPGAE